ncbi:hypothetical protein ACJX0J_039160, partial [Zea mays]
LGARTRLVIWFTLYTKMDKLLKIHPWICDNGKLALHVCLYAMEKKIYKEYHIQSTCSLYGYIVVFMINLFYGQTCHGYPILFRETRKDVSMYKEICHNHNSEKKVVMIFIQKGKGKLMLDQS